MQAGFPAMPLYWKDWLTGEGTSAMTAEQEGAFLRLLLHAWDASPPCTLPNDVTVLAGKAKLTPERWAEVAPLILAQFKVVRKKLRNRKQWKIYSELMEHRLKKSEAGKTGNVKRWGEDSSSVAQRSHSDTYANRKRIANASPPSPSPSPSPSAKQKPPKSPKGEYSPEFLAFWAEYPARAGSANKVGAWKAWNARLRDFTASEMTAGAKRYAAFCFDTGALRTQYVKQASSFLGDREEPYFMEPWTSPPKKGIPADSPAASTKNERPQASGERLGEWVTPGGQKLESDEDRDSRRVEVWRKENDERARVLWQECINEVAETFAGQTGIFTEVAGKAMVSSKFRSRVIAEHLTPRLSA